MFEPIPVIVGFSGNLEDTAFINPHSQAEKFAVRSRRRGFGGTSINVARQLVELGMSPSCMVTVGEDTDAQTLHEIMKQQKLTSYLINCREYTSHAYVRIIQDGQQDIFRRTIDSDKAPYVRFPVGSVAQISRFPLRSGCAIATGCTVEEEPLITAMFENAVTKVLNPRESLCANTEVFRRLLRNTDILCLNEGEIRSALKIGDAYSVSHIHLAELAEMGPRIVIATLGREGAIVFKKWRDTGSVVTTMAYFAGEAKDETGAGDAFLSGFLACHLHGFPLPDAANFARVVAGIKVTKIGGSNVATIKEILQHAPDWSIAKYWKEAKAGAV